ncbi:MAG: DegV family protein [Clostridiales bacterium]|nr:DegV family protein [Clostridiales bacterium]
MNDFVIYADTASDIDEKRAEAYDVQLIKLPLTMDGSPLDDHFDTKVFYDKLRDGAVASTSAANTATLTDLFEKELAAGKDVLYIAFSSGLSVTYGCAVLAKEELETRFPERKICVVDSLAASSGYGLLVYYASKMKKDGNSIDEIEQFITENRLHLCHQFTVDDLFFLKRGGRISAATALAGSMLNIKPVLHVDDEGHLINIGKARGRLASIKALADKMVDTVINPLEQKVMIGHGDCEKDAQLLAEMIRKQMGITDIEIYYIGPVIGAHSGPGTLALFYLGTQR